MVFGGLPPLITSGYIRIRFETALEAKNSERFAESASLASEAVLAIKTVSSLTLESTVLERYNDLLSDIVRVSIKSLVWTIGSYAISQSLEFLVMALGFWYGSELLLAGEYTITQFYVIFIGVLFAGQAAAQVSQGVSRIRGPYFTNSLQSSSATRLASPKPAEQPTTSSGSDLAPR